MSAFSESGADGNPSPRSGPQFSRERLADIKSNSSPYLVKGVLPARGVGFVAGPSTTAKTFFCIEVGCRVSRGEPFQGRRARQVGVVYVGAEDASGIRLRIEAWCERNGRHGSLQLIPEAPNLRDGPSLTMLIREIVAAADDFEADGLPLGLVVIDTLSKAAPGADQNSSADMGEVMSALARISAETDSMVLVVAHTPKDETRGIAGWHGQFAGADLVIMTARDSDDPALRTATLSKVKNGQDGAKLAFRLDVVDMGDDEDGDPITSCVLEFEDAPARSLRKAVTASRLTSPENIALRAMGHVLDHGQTVAAPRVPGVPPGTMAVRIGDVRTQASLTGFSDEGDKPEAVKKRWTRAIEGLVSKERLRKEGDLLWPV